MLDARKRVAAAVRDYIARERMSREQFAFRTKLGKSTVDKLLTGLFSEKTLSIVESHTKLALRPMLHTDLDHLPGDPAPRAGQAGKKLRRVERRLAAIFAADVAGYSRLVRADESGTLCALSSHREIMDGLIAEHGGRIANTAGDSVLAEFPSVVDAVQCALAVQDRLAEANEVLAKDKRICFRIGVHVGDVVLSGKDLLGDGVNIAARIETLADPGGICVSAAAFDYVRQALPLVFDDLGPQQLRNVDEPIRVFAVKRLEPDPRNLQDLARPKLIVPDNPSIAVLPFSNMNQDAERDYLADGISEDIITALARLRWLFVIARNSTFAYKGRAVDTRQVARDLGVRYVLEGSVRTVGQRIRVTGQLIDAQSGKHIWAEKYDRELQDIFAVQDDITERVVAAVEPHLYAEEGFRASAKPPDSIDAWGLVVRALGLINRMGRKQNEEAQALLRRAVAIEPSYARSHALLGWAVRWAGHCSWRPDRGEAHREAMAHAQNALSFDASDPWARMVSGLCFSTAGQHDRALGELRTALAFNPSFALGHTMFGWTLLRAGQFDEAIAETACALRLSPMDSFSGFYTSVHGLALLGAGRFEDALPFLRASVAAFSEYAGHYNTLISCCGHLGLIEEAQEFIAASNAIGPRLALSNLRRSMANFAHRDVFIEGLRKAGVPET